MNNNEILNKFVERGIINKNAADDFLLNGGASPIDFLVHNGYCSMSQALELTASYYQLLTVSIDSLDIDSSLINKISYSILVKNKFLPIELNKNVMTVAISNPLNPLAFSPIKAIHNGEFKYILVSEQQLISKIQLLSATNSVENSLNSLVATNKSHINEANEIANAPAVKFVDSIIKEAVSLKASDIHIEPMQKIVRIRYRQDGSLINRIQFPIEAYSAVCARIKILSGMNITEKRLPQDGHMEKTIDKRDYDFRVSTMPNVYGEKIVIRILDKSDFSFSLSELGFIQSESNIIDKILTHNHGLILLTGPTGCGKTTTLYSLLRELNKPDINIVTVEDPVEYTMHGINQTQINTKANLNFAGALRNILRQDPDIIMIGEIRDEETAQIAVRAAMTGHLVLSTLHTNDTPSAINRLIDMNIEPYLIADTVIAIIAQRLIKKLCPKCKQKVISDNTETAMLELSKPIEIYRPCGCTFCNNTGYKGRTAVPEIMYVDDKIRAAINNRTHLDNLKAIAYKNGTIKLKDSCRKLVLNGTTDISEFAKLIND